MPVRAYIGSYKEKWLTPLPYRAVASSTQAPPDTSYEYKKFFASISKGRGLFYPD